MIYVQTFLRAVDRIASEELSEQIQIVYGNAAEYSFEEHAYDVASCISASMIWGGFRPSIRRMKDAIHSSGKVVIAEPYYTHRDVPPELREYEGDCHTELELFDIAREEGFQVGYVDRSSREDWDRYVHNRIGTDMCITKFQLLEKSKRYQMLLNGRNVGQACPGGKTCI